MMVTDGALAAPSVAASASGFRHRIPTRAGVGRTSQNAAFTALGGTERRPELTTKKGTEMASKGKKKTTMAKLARESRLRERRLDKQAKKDARKRMQANNSEQSGESAEPLA